MTLLYGSTFHPEDTWVKSNPGWMQWPLATTGPTGGGRTMADAARMAESAKRAQVNFIRISPQFDYLAEPTVARPQAWWADLSNWTGSNHETGLAWQKTADGVTNDLDVWVNALSQAGIQIMFMVGYGALWLPYANNGPNNEAKAVETDPWSGDTSLTNREALAKYLSAYGGELSRRYGSAVTWWEIWNEWTFFSSGSFKGFWDWSIDAYRVLFANTAYMIKKFTPGALCGWNSEQTDKIAGSTNWNGTAADQFFRANSGSPSFIDYAYTSLVDGTQNIRPPDVCDLVIPHEYADRSGSGQVPENYLNGTQQFVNRVNICNNSIRARWNPPGVNGGVSGGNLNTVSAYKAGISGSSTRGNKLFVIGEFGWHDVPAGHTTYLSRQVSQNKQAALLARVVLEALPAPVGTTATADPPLLAGVMQYDMVNDGRVPNAGATAPSPNDAQFDERQYGLFLHSENYDGSSNLEPDGTYKIKPSGLMWSNLKRLLDRTEYKAPISRTVSIISSTQGRILLEFPPNSQGIKLWVVWCYDTVNKYGDIAAVSQSVTINVGTRQVQSLNMTGTVATNLTKDGSNNVTVTATEAPLFIIDQGIVLTPPATPGTLTGSLVGQTQADLAWGNVSDEDGYVIQRRLVGATIGFADLATVGPNVVSYSDTGLPIGQTYRYRVRAFNGNGISAYTNEVEIVTGNPPPAAPSGLTLVTNQHNSVSFSWTDNANNELAYTVERAIGAGAFSALTTSLAADTTSYTDGTVTPSTSYQYRVRATNSGGASAYSNTISVTTPIAPPNAATNLAATPGTGIVSLTWTPGSGATSQDVQRHAGDNNWATIASSLGPSTSSYNDTAVSAGVTYFYRIRGTNSSGSAFSNVASTSPVATPATPTSLVASSVAWNSVVLAWVDNATNETGYIVERVVGPSGGTWGQVSPSLSIGSTGYTDTTVSPSTVYRFRVIALGTGGVNSNPSNEVTVTTPAQPPPPPIPPASPEDLIVYLGPERGVEAFPLTIAGDWTPVSGSWLDVTQYIRAAECSGGEHEAELRLTLKDWAQRSQTFIDHAMIMVRGRYWNAQARTWGSWSIWFGGYIVGEADMKSQRGEHGPVHEGQIICRQEWSYLVKQQAAATRFGLVNVATGASASASSTLGSPSQEAGVEFLGAATVVAANVTDGNPDTVWVSNTVAEPPAANEAPFIGTGKTVRITELYSGRQPSFAIGGNGRPLWIELWCADVVYTSSFEGGGLDGWGATGNNSTVQNVAGIGVSNSRALLIQGPGATKLAVDGGASVRFAGVTPEVEACISFSMRGDGGPAALDVLVGGGGGQGGADVIPIQVSGTEFRRFVFRYASGNSEISLRFKFKTGTRGLVVDDVRCSGGVRLRDSGAMKVHLIWDDGRGNSGVGEFPRHLGLDAMAGESYVIVTDDAELFGDQFDPGPDATVVQFREIAGLRGLDFASRRGRLRLAYWKRWFDGSNVYPDLRGDSGAVWDDIQLGSLPTFTATTSIARTSLSSWIERQNPAPAGAETWATSWVNVVLPDFPAASLTAAMGTGASGTIAVTTTDGYPANGWFYIESERLWMTRQDAMTWQYSNRSAPVAHGIGSKVYLETNVALPGATPDYQRLVQTAVSVIGFTRKAGTPIVQDFDIIASTSTSPGDPSVNNLWGSHPDWKTLVRVRNNVRRSPVYLVGRTEHDIQPVTWPPLSGWRPANQGIPVKHLRLVIMRQERWNGVPQRAKVNEIIAYGQDYDATQGSAWNGTSPSDIRGIVAHILTRYGRVQPDRIRISQRYGVGLPWGANYGSLTTAEASAAEVIAGLENKGQLRVICSRDNVVQIVPDPLSTAAAWDAASMTWRADTATTISVKQAEAGQVSQVIVTGKDGITGEVFRGGFPGRRSRYGEPKEITGLIIGDQGQADEAAHREYRQRNARLTADIETRQRMSVQTWDRHILDYTAGDADQADWSGEPMLVTGWKWSLRPSDHGNQWSLAVSLRELEPF